MSGWSSYATKKEENHSNSQMKVSKQRIEKIILGLVRGWLKRTKKPKKANAMVPINGGIAYKVMRDYYTTAERNGCYPADLFIMSPHPDNFNGSRLFKHLIHQPVLDVDPP